MLRISKLADYGTIIMVYLARHKDKLCNARDIAKQTHISMPTVSKLLKSLTAAGLLISVRGAMGGYRLRLPAQDVSVSEILHAIDEPRGLTECGDTPHACALREVCYVQGNWRIISQMIESTLQNVSLEALASPNMILQQGNKV